MGYISENFYFDRGNYNAATGEFSPALHKYGNLGDTFADMLVSGYFNNAITDQPAATSAQEPSIRIKDTILVKSSDKVEIIEVLALSPNVTTQAITGGSPSSLDLSDAHIFVGNASNQAADVAMSGDTTISNTGVVTIGAQKVLLSHLSSGIVPSHVTKFGAEYTTTGGAAAEAITVTGALATDIAFVQLKTPGGAPVTILNAAVTADTLTVTFSADPSNNHIIYYQIMRAAA